MQREAAAREAGSVRSCAMRTAGSGATCLDATLPTSRASRVNDLPSRSARSTAPARRARTRLLMQAIFRMGIPVTGKNVFPSNIQGLPTWYEIRVSKDGYTARPADVDLVVALNTGHVRERRRGASDRADTCSYDSSWPLDDTLVREGITILGIPFGKTVRRVLRGRPRADAAAQHRLRRRASPRCSRSTWTSVGEMLREKFSKKKRAARRELPRHPARLRLRARTHYDCPLPFHLARMNETNGQRLLDGNSARRARRRVRRRDGRRVVSDHAVDVADGGVQGV